MNEAEAMSLTKAIERALRRLQTIEASQDDTHTKHLRSDANLELLLTSIAGVLPPEQQHGIKACLEVHCRLWHAGMRKKQRRNEHGTI